MDSRAAISPEVGPSVRLDQGEGPLVTVVMSVYRSGPYFEEAVRSILGQSYRNLEFLIVDDGDPDAAAWTWLRGLADPRVRVLHQLHAGKAAALNRALAEAQGEFYAIQDADDVSAPTRIARQVELMLEHPELACTFCGFELILNGQRTAPLSPQKSVSQCRADIEAFQQPGHDPTSMFRTAMVRDLRWEESLVIGQGYDYSLRVGERFPMMNLGECLYSYRVAADSHSRRDPIRRDELVRATLRRACGRRGVGRDQWPPALLRPPVTPDSHGDPDNNLAAHFIESALHQRRSGDYWGGLRTALACARLRPLDPHYLKPLLYMLLPQPLLRLRRSARVRQIGMS